MGAILFSFKKILYFQSTPNSVLGVSNTLVQFSKFTDLKVFKTKLYSIQNLK
jgi:hypothetical protein